MTYLPVLFALLTVDTWFKSLRGGGRRDAKVVNKMPKLAKALAMAEQAKIAPAMDRGPNAYFHQIHE
jgi:hypothetical protein